MKGRPRLYDWDRWFESGRFTLVKGVDYQCSQASMSQQIRIAASERKVGVSIREGIRTLDVEVRERGMFQKELFPPRRQTVKGCTGVELCLS